LGKLLQQLSSNRNIFKLTYAKNNNSKVTKATELLTDEDKNRQKAAAILSQLAGYRSVRGPHFGNSIRARTSFNAI